MHEIWWHTVVRNPITCYKMSTYIPLILLLDGDPTELYVFVFRSSYSNCRTDFSIFFRNSIFPSEISFNNKFPCHVTFLIYEVDIFDCAEIQSGLIKSPLGLCRVIDSNLYIQWVINFKVSYETKSCHIFSDLWNTEHIN